MAGAPLGYGPRKVPGSENVCPTRSAMNSAKSSPTVSTSLIGLAHPIAAVHVEGLSHHVVAVAGSQKYGRPGMIFGHSHPAIRDRLTHDPLFLTGRAVFVFGKQRVVFVPHRRVDHPGRNPINVDLVLDQR